ncbi:MAG TPA: hypothetical protein VGH88_02330 [Streptosporangiaceae bacterium]
MRLAHAVPDGGGQPLGEQGHWVGRGLSRVEGRRLARQHRQAAQQFPQAATGHYRARPGQLVAHGSSSLDALVRMLASAAPA